MKQCHGRVVLGRSRSALTPVLDHMDVHAVDPQRSGASSETGAAHIVESRDLTLRFGPITAIHHVSLHIAQGEVFALIGPNGAGKSTLMKMFTTMLPPSSGQAIIAGFDVAKAPQQVRSHIGYVPQVLSADGELTGYENMMLSVSYTHLRAHETGRNLVCRLLLEK